MSTITDSSKLDDTRKSGGFLSFFSRRSSAAQPSSRTQDTKERTNNSKSKIETGSMIKAPKKSTGSIGKYFSTLSSRSKSKKKKEQMIQEQTTKKIALFTRRSDRELHNQFFKKLNKKDSGSTIIPQKVNLHTVASIVQRKSKKSEIGRSPPKSGPGSQRFVALNTLQENSPSEVKQKRDTVDSPDKGALTKYITQIKEGSQATNLDHKLGFIGEIDNNTPNESPREENKDNITTISKEGMEPLKKKSSFISIFGNKKSSFNTSSRNFATNGSFTATRPNYYMKSLEYYYLMNKTDYIADLYKKHFNQTFSSMRFMKMVDMQEAEEFALQNQQDLKKKMFCTKMKTIVFDLDETLVHCTDTGLGEHTIKIPFPNGEVIEASFFVRPYTQETLEKLSNHFELIAFTASHKCYADKILNIIDPNKVYFSHRLFRDHCFKTKQGIYIKDLRIINRPHKDLILVDNAAYSYGFQMNNGIPIIPFYNSKEDAELLFLTEYLMSLKNEPDVRKVIADTFKLEEYTNYENLKECFAGIFGRTKK